MQRRGWIDQIRERKMGGRMSHKDHKAAKAARKGHKIKLFIKNFKVVEL
jgi:hypothetical protein